MTKYHKDYTTKLIHFIDKENKVKKMTYPKSHS